MLSETWPPQLREWVAKSLSQISDSNRDDVQAELKQVLSEAFSAHTLWTTDWAGVQLKSLMPKQPPVFNALKRKDETTPTATNKKAKEGTAGKSSTNSYSSTTTTNYNDFALYRSSSEQRAHSRNYRKQEKSDNYVGRSRSQPPHRSANQLATTSSQIVNFFSANNVSISGGSFHLNVYPIDNPDHGISNSASMTSVQQPVLFVSDELLGIGSCGTVVFRGSFQGRPVAVKKTLREFITLAEREVSILQESDNHPNVIQYFYQETRENFLCIAIELCAASLADIIEMPDRDRWRDIVVNFDPKRALEEIMSGLDHLHKLNVVHRDVKPQNILISAAQRTASSGKGCAGHRMVISDFGLCKKLDDDQTSFLPSNHGTSAAGTRGWQAPEILRISLEKSQKWAGRDTVANSSALRKLTKSMDIFPLGCLLYYTLTKGMHPYGYTFEREVNILKDAKDLTGVEKFGEEGLKAKDLIITMLNPEPNQRPDTTMCLKHPYLM